MTEIKSPNPIVVSEYSIFLGGTIDNGDSINWQQDFKNHLETHCLELKDKITLLNPRRDDWDSSWVQHIDNPQFNEQVMWELEAMEKAHTRIFVFLPDSKSPITLLELGLNVNKNCMVYCPYEYFRSGNVHIICREHLIPCFTDWEIFKSKFNDC